MAISITKTSLCCETHIYTVGKLQSCVLLELVLHIVTTWI